MAIVAFVGDTHGEIDKMYELLLAWQERSGIKIDACVQVGDFGIFLEPRVQSDFSDYWHGRKQVPIKTFVDPGNHEDHTVIKIWEKRPEKIPNLRLLPDGEVSDVVGLRIASIWGNFSPISWNDPNRVEQSRRGGAGGPRAMHIYRPACERLLADPSTIDVLVTHEAPKRPWLFGGLEDMGNFARGQLGLEESEEPKGCPAFSEIVRLREPAFHFFGHFHIRREAFVGKTKTVCLDEIGSGFSRAVDIVGIGASHVKWS